MASHSANSVARQARKAKRATKKTAANPTLEFLERAGYLIRGVLYAAMGAFALGLALGLGGTATDQSGSLRILTGGPAGRLMLFAVVIGLSAYSIWGFVRAIFDPLHRGKDPAGIAERLGFAWSGIAYAAIVIFALHLIAGAAGSDHDGTQETIARILTLPAGHLIAMAIGIAAIGAGLGRNAGSMNGQVERKLRANFADHLIVDFDPKQDLADLLTPRARIVVAGGDGTVEFVVRKFADTKHPVAILPMGTFNNLARALGLPAKLDAAIKVARTGRPRAITLGRVNDHIFVEACAVGLFGETIALGDSAKDLAFGKFAGKLVDIIAARAFRYELGGDLEGSGSAMSLVFSNTASIGSQLPISEGTPNDPYLEFSVHAGRTRSDIVGRALKSGVLMQHVDEASGVFRFKRLEVKTRPRARVYADNVHVGRTPATVTAVASALKVLLPT